MLGSTMSQNRHSSALSQHPAEPSDLIAEVRLLAGPQVIIEEALLDAAMRAWSNNTLRAFRSDLRR
jgi:hypothetical protein